MALNFGGGISGDVIRVRPESGRSDLSPLCCHLMDFLRQETISYFTSPLGGV